MIQGDALARGLIGAAAATGCMTTLRMAARRIGLIDRTPPQATKHWLAERTGREPATTVGHHVADSVIHLAVGLAAGAAYGALVTEKPRPGLVQGALFGLGVWAVAFGFVAPRLGILPPPRADRWMETAVNVAAHLVYGVAMALVTGELAQQVHGPDATVRRIRARTG